MSRSTGLRSSLSLKRLGRSRNRPDDLESEPATAAFAIAASGRQTRGSLLEMNITIDDVQESTHEDDGRVAAVACAGGGCGSRRGRQGSARLVHWQNQIVPRRHAVTEAGERRSEVAPMWFAILPAMNRLPEVESRADPSLAYISCGVPLAASVVLASLA